jgi:ATP-binding cassette subfamily F protein 3
VETAEGLALALKAYGGTVIFVSHARTFVNALADRIFEIRGGTLRHYAGTYEEYVNDLATLVEEDAREGMENGKSQMENWGGKMTSAERSLRRAELKERQRKSEKLATTMEKFDKEKSIILQYFFDNPTDYAPEKNRRLGEIDEELARVEKEWVANEEAIERLKT